MSLNNLEGDVLRYKRIYSATALILGLSVAISGIWLASLNGYYTEAKGWMLHIFGCAILYNNNNMAPGFWLFLVGLFLIIVTQYRIRTNRKLEEKDKLDRRALRSKFTFSMAGLFAGLVVTLYGITFAESGTNLCPADLVPDLPIEYFSSYFDIGAVLFVVGIITITATRFRVRIYKDREIVKQSKGLISLNARFHSQKKRSVTMKL